MLVMLKKFYLSKSLTSCALKVLLASVFIGISANLKLHLGLVPFTMQTAAVLALSYVLGSRLAVMAVAAWIAQGLAGAPVFASGAGFAALVGPSGGYIVGFLAMAYAMGLAKDNGVCGALALSLYALFATALLYASGLFVLSFYVGAKRVLEIGLYPFVLSDTLKAIFAAFLLAPLSKIFKNL